MSQSIIEESHRAKKGIFTHIFKKKYLYFLIVLILIAFSVNEFLLKDNSKEEVSSIKQSVVSREDIILSVEASGKIVAKDGVILSFPVSGNLEVEEVLVKEGDEIKKGDEIASVKTETLNFELQSALNNYNSTLASYNEKISGASDIDIAKAKIKIEEASISLSQAETSLIQTEKNALISIANSEESLENYKEAYLKNQSIDNSEAVDDSYKKVLTDIRSIVINIEKMLRDSDEILGVDDKSINDEFESALGVTDTGSYSRAKNSYTQVKNNLNELSSKLLSLTYNSHYSVDLVADQTEDLLDLAYNHYNDMQTMINASISFIGLSQSQIDGFKNTISNNRSAINSSMLSFDNTLSSLDDVKDNLDDYKTNYDKAIRDLDSVKSQMEQNILTAENNVRSREISLEQANLDYEELTEALSGSDLVSAQSQLSSASISVDKAKYNVSQATLVAPIDGVVSQLNYKEGDIILSDGAKTMATILNKDTLYIEVNVEESDISDLKIGQKAIASFDAIDNLSLEGELSFISLTSSTNNNGIVTYLVRVSVENVSDSQVREGMTAVVEFVSFEALDVLTVPVSAVKNINGEPSVQLIDGEIKAVITGFTDGRTVEIISGVEEGDIVIY